MPGLHFELPDWPAHISNVNPRGEAVEGDDRRLACDVSIVLEGLPVTILDQCVVDNEFGGWGFLYSASKDGMPLALGIDCLRFSHKFEDHIFVLTYNAAGKKATNTFDGATVKKLEAKPVHAHAINLKLMVQLHPASVDKVTAALVKDNVHVEIRKPAQADLANEPEA